MLIQWRIQARGPVGLCFGPKKQLGGAARGPRSPHYFYTKAEAPRIEARETTKARKMSSAPSPLLALLLGLDPPLLLGKKQCNSVLSEPRETKCVLLFARLGVVSTTYPQQRNKLICSIVLSLFHIQLIFQFYGLYKNTCITEELLMVM